MGVLTQAKPAAPKVAKNIKLYVTEWYHPTAKKIFKYYDSNTEFGYLVKNINPSINVDEVKVTCSTKRAYAFLNRAENGSVYLVTNCKFDNDGYPITTLPSHYTISFKIKQNNKTYKLKTKVTVKPFARPLKSMKICGKNVTSKAKQSKIPTIKVAGKKLTYSVKFKSGYSLLNILLMSAQPDADGDYYYSDVSSDYVLQKGDTLLIQYGKGESEYNYNIIKIK